MGLGFRGPTYALLKQVIAGISSQKSEGEEAAAMPAQQAPFPQDPEAQVQHPSWPCALQ